MTGFEFGIQRVEVQGKDVGAKGCENVDFPVDQKDMLQSFKFSIQIEPFFVSETYFRFEQERNYPYGRFLLNKNQ